MVGTRRTAQDLASGRIAGSAGIAVAVALVLWTAGCAKTTVSGMAMGVSSGSWDLQGVEIPYLDYFSSMAYGVRIDHRSGLGPGRHIYEAADLVVYSVQDPDPSMPPEYVSQVASSILVPRIEAGVAFSAPAGETMEVGGRMGLRLALWPAFTFGAKTGPASSIYKTTNSTTGFLSIPLGFELSALAGGGKIITCVEYDLAFNSPGYGIYGMSDDNSDSFSTLSLSVGYQW